MKRKMLFILGVFFVVLLAGLFVFKNSFYKYPDYISEMNVNRLWNESEGENITIAFLDSGMHQELIEIYGDRVVNQYDFVNNTETMIDTNGHGTAMICLATCNHKDTGIYGIAPKTKVMPLRIFDSYGDTTDERITTAIYFAVDNGADIINMSFGSYEDSIEVENAIDYAVQNNVFVICSAGDYISSLTAFPARYDKTIAVANLSDYIIGVEYEYIDVIIEGDNIESLRYSESQDTLVGNCESGSSVSTALLSGIIALKICYMAEVDRTEFLNNMIANNIEHDLGEIVDY
jgi:subtilisin family serine protease